MNFILKILVQAVVAEVGKVVLNLIKKRERQSTPTKRK